MRLNGLRLLLLACVIPGSGCGGCQPCNATEATALDYDKDDSWACRPGNKDDACSGDLSAADVAPNGDVTVVEHTPLADPPVACFWVYPTVDLNAVPDTHEDFDDTSNEETAVTVQAARFTEVCSMHAPFYRQVNIGVYTGEGLTEKERTDCFEIPIVDIARAFEVFIKDIGEDTPYMVGGHSQGAQMVTELVRRVIEERESLLDRLVVALPIGWPLGTDSESDVGGTFSKVPICSAPDQIGCAMGFRSFGKGNDLPKDPHDGKVLKTLFKGDDVVCTNPAGADGDTMSRSFFPVENGFVDIPQAAKDANVPFVRYADTFTAECKSKDTNAALEIGAAPGRSSVLDFGRILLSGDSGTHLLDMHFAQGDLIDTVKTRGDAWVVAHPPVEGQ